MQGAYALPAIDTRFGTLFGRIDGRPVLHDEDGLYRLLEKQGAFRAKKKLRYNAQPKPAYRITGITAEQEQALRADGYVTKAEYCEAKSITQSEVRCLMRAKKLDRVEKGYVYKLAPSGKQSNSPHVWVRERQV
jgi:hypothetical protein